MLIILTVCTWQTNVEFLLTFRIHFSTVSSLRVCNGKYACRALFAFGVDISTSLELLSRLFEKYILLHSYTLGYSRRILGLCSYSQQTSNIVNKTTKRSCRINNISLDIICMCKAIQNIQHYLYLPPSFPTPSHKFTKYLITARDEPEHNFLLHALTILVTNS